MVTIEYCTDWTARVIRNKKLAASAHERHLLSRFFHHEIACPNRSTTARALCTDCKSAGFEVMVARPEARGIERFDLVPFQIAKDLAQRPPRPFPVDQEQEEEEILEEGVVENEVETDPDQRDEMPETEEKLQEAPVRPLSGEDFEFELNASCFDDMDILESDVLPLVQPVTPLPQVVDISSAPINMSNSSFSFAFKPSDTFQEFFIAPLPELDQPEGQANEDVNERIGIFDIQPPEIEAAAEPEQLEMEEPVERKGEEEEEEAVAEEEEEEEERECVDAEESKKRKLDSSTLCSGDADSEPEATSPPRKRSRVELLEERLLEQERRHQRQLIELTAHFTTVQNTTVTAVKDMVQSFLSHLAPGSVVGAGVTRPPSHLTMENTF